MAECGETPLEGCEQTSPRVTLADSVIATRNLPRLVEPPRPERRSTELVSPSTVCLDQEDIGTTEKLQSLWNIYSLCLQQNNIEKIKNLSCFPNLRFLSLAGNRIRIVENLQPLRRLQFLDLSHNQIQTLDPDELPCNLCFLDLTGNECTHQHGYREMVLGALPCLLQLDSQPVRGGVGEEEEEGASSSTEDEDDELLSEPSGPFTADKDFFEDLHEQLASRSHWRRKEAAEEHRTHLNELEELQERWGLLLPPTPWSPGREGAACTTAPGPRRSQPCPQVKPGMQLPPLPGPSRQHTCLQPQRAPSGHQRLSKTLQGETHIKGARHRQFPPAPRTGTAPHGWD